MKKRLVIAGGIAAVIALLFFFSIRSAQKEASEAVSAFNAAAQEYNDSIAPYNEAANRIAAADEELQKVIDRAQEDIDSKEEAYEPDLQKELEEELEKARKLPVDVPAQLDPFEMMTLKQSFRKGELSVQQQEAEAAKAAVYEAGEKIPDVPQVPDFSKDIESLQNRCEAYEKSVQKLKNVTAPSDSFVMERLQKISTLVQAEAVTEQNDPNELLGKEDGYIGCIYFLDERVNRDLLPEEAFLKEEKEQEEGSGDKTDSEGDADEGSTASGQGAETADTADTAENATEESQEAGTAVTGEAAARESSSGRAAEEPGQTADTSSAAAAGTAESAQTENEAGTGASVSVEEVSAGGSTQAAETAPEKKIDVVMIGTAGGGAVEIFSSKKEARKREKYLAFFDGSVMEAGSHDREGTCIIRTSKYLSEEEQKELTEMIREALLEVD